MFFCQFLDKNEKKEKITFPLILICTVQKEANDPKPLVQFVDHTNLPITGSYIFPKFFSIS